MSSTQEALNSDPITQVQEGQIDEGVNNLREEPKETDANLQATETKANPVAKKTKKAKSGPKAAVETGEVNEKANTVQDEANIQNAQPSETQPQDTTESKPIKKKTKKASSKKEEENVNQPQENGENKEIKPESVPVEENKEVESTENKPKKKKKVVAKTAAPVSNEAENAKPETTTTEGGDAQVKKVEKVEKNVPTSKPVEKASVKPAAQTDPKQKEGITVTKGDAQKPANLKELAKQDAKEKVVPKAAEKVAETAKTSTTNKPLEKPQAQPVDNNKAPAKTPATQKSAVVEKVENGKTKVVAPATTAKSGQVENKAPSSLNKIVPEQQQGKKVETTEVSQAQTKKAKSPDSYKQAVKNIKTEKGQGTIVSPGQRPKTAIEKQRIRSFDAGKTDKISADDSFETRGKLWEIRKKEKLLGQEKKKRRKESEECTFTPQLNKNSMLKELAPGDIYMRSAEWSTKVKEALAEKSEKILEEARKPEVKKSRVNSAVGSRCFETKNLRPSHDERIRKAHLQYPQQNILEIKDNVVDKVSEIREMYDVITSAIKNKSKRVIPQSSDPLKKTKLNTHEESRVGSATIAHQQHKSTGGKSNANGVKNDEQIRLESLKGILNLKSNRNSGVPTKPVETTTEDSAQVYVSQTKNVDDLIKQNSKRLEIVNNRYVMVDNLSSVEHREADNNDLSLEDHTVEIM